MNRFRADDIKYYWSYMRDIQGVFVKISPCFESYTAKDGTIKKRLGPKQTIVDYCLG